MATISEIREAKPPIYLDELDQALMDMINAEGRIALSDLPKQYPELMQIPHAVLWYRIHSLAAEKRIRVKRARKKLMCFSVSDGNVED